MPYLLHSGVRLAIGVVCMSIFYMLGMLIHHELQKLTAWIILFVLGPIGFCMVWLSDKLAARLMIASWIILLGDASIKGFIRLYFGIRPNPSEVFSAVLYTTLNESFEFITAQWRLLLESLSVLLVCITLCIIVEIKLSTTAKRTVTKKAGWQSKSVSLLCLLLFIAAFFNPVMRRQNPVVFWFNWYGLYTERVDELASFNDAFITSDKQLSTTVYSGEQHRTVVLIIGESLTRNNMSLYGYERETTPVLDSKRDELLVFDDVISPSYLTAFSVVKMLSPATISAPDQWKNNPTIVQLAKAAGYKTFWLSNQMALDGWVTFIARQTDDAVFTNVGDMIAESAFDGVLLPHIEQALNDTSPLKLIVVHLLGNHFYYSLRYPDNYKIYDRVEDIVTKKMVQAGRAPWVVTVRNQYDNSVAYNDKVVTDIIKAVQLSVNNSPSALVYLSDHGQEVGHNRDFTRHSAIDNTGWEIPMVMWSNQTLALPKTVLEKRPYQTDRFDATLLGLLKITTPYYRAEDDVLSKRFITRPRMLEDKLYTLDKLK